MRWTAAVDLLDPLAESLLSEDAGGQRVPWTRETLFERSGLQVVWDAGPTLDGTFPQGTVSGTPKLVIYPSGQPSEDPLPVWVRKDLPAPLEIRLSSPGLVTFGQESFSIGSGSNYEPSTGTYVPSPAPVSFSTTAQAGEFTDRLDVKIGVWFQDYQVQLINRSLLAPPQLQLSIASGSGDYAMDELGTVTVESGDLALQVENRRGGGFVKGGEVRFRLIGEGSLSQTNVLTDTAGAAAVVFTPPTVSSPPEPGDEYGVTIVTVHYVEDGHSFSDSLVVRYLRRVGGEPEGDGSQSDTPDQYLAAVLLSDIITSHSPVDPGTGLIQPDLVAIRGEARTVLSQWWGAPGDYQTMGPDALVGSVMYWLERTVQLPVDLVWETHDLDFTQALTDAIANWSQWFAVADALGIEPTSVPGFNALAAQERIIAALNAGIDRVSQRCVARANDYKNAPDDTLAEQQIKQNLLERLVDEGLEVFGYYSAGYHLQVFDSQPDTLDEILGALCFTPEISTDENETFLDLGSSVSRARLQLRAGIRVDGIDELLYVNHLPVIVRPLDGATVERGIGSTDADGYYRDWVQLGAEKGSADIHVTVAWQDITFSERVLHLESVPQIALRVARESDGPSALSTTVPTLVDGERLLVEVQLRRGNSPLAGRAVFSTVFGSASDTDLFKVTQGDGTVRFFATPDKDQNGTLQLAVTFREKGDLYVQTLSVPYVSTKAGASTRDAYSAAQLEAAARAGQALGQAIINGAILDQDPVIDYDALEAAQRFWLEAGLNDPSEPLGLQQRINTATIDTIEDVLLEYHRWQATNQLLAVDDRFPIGDLETQLTTQYRAAVDSLLQLVWDWDPESSNEAPSAGGARRLLQLAAQVEQIGRDRFPNNPDDESYSFQSLLKRLGYELRIDHLLLDGPAEYALLTIDVNYYLYVSDPGLGGSGGDKAAAMTTDSVPVVVDVVPFNGLLVEEDGSFRRIAPGGHYTSAVKLAPGATELVLDVLATDPAYPTIFDWQRQIRLSGEYRLDATARKAGQDEAEWTSDPVISSHLTTPEQAVIRAELMKGRGLLEGQQVVAELLAPAKGQLVRDGDAGDRFIYTPPQGADNAPPGQEATQTIRLTTLIDGQRQTTDLTVTYRNVMAGTPGEVGPNSLWAWITRQFDALTTPLADQNQPEAGVGSSFGLDDIQLPSLGGSFNRAAGYAGGLLDWSMEAFDVLGAVELGDLLGFLQNGPPAETRDLIRFSFDLSSISAILSPTLLAADFTDLLPDGFSGQVAIDRPELTGQLVFGVDTSDDPFYILTRPDQFGVAASDQSVATDMGARFAVFAQVDSNVELFGGLLGIDHAEGHLSTKVAVDWSRVAAGDGKLRLSDLGQLQNLRVGFDGNPIDTFQLTVGGHAQIAGLSDGPSAAGSDPPDDPLLSMHVAGVSTRHHSIRLIRASSRRQEVTCPSYLNCVPDPSTLIRLASLSTYCGPRQSPMTMARRLTMYMSSAATTDSCLPVDLATWERQFIGSRLSRLHCATQQIGFGLKRRCVARRQAMCRSILLTIAVTSIWSCFGRLSTKRVVNRF